LLFFLPAFISPFRALTKEEWKFAHSTSQQTWFSSEDGNPGSGKLEGVSNRAGGHCSVPKRFAFLSRVNLVKSNILAIGSFTIFTFRNKGKKVGQSTVRKKSFKHRMYAFNS
jgi:hypothetical protein